MKIFVRYAKETPWTTGWYVWKACKDLGFEVFDTEEEASQHPDLDAVITVEPSTPNRVGSAKNIYWEIDGHLRGGANVGEYEKADLLFVASSRRDLPKYHGRALFLPTAADPEVHKRYVEKVEYDLAIVGIIGGHSGYGERERLLKLAEDNGYRTLKLSNVYHQEYSQALSRSKLIFNRSLEGDLNMRFWEGMSIGCLITNNLGHYDLAQPAQHYLAYQSDDDFLNLLAKYTKDDDAREKIAKNARELIVLRHNYKNRVLEMLSYADLL